MNRSWLFVSFGLGALAMFLMDPEQGRRRRAMVRDKATSVGNRAKDVAESNVQHLRNKAEGVAAKAKARLRHDAPNDQKICDRVRSAMGRVLEHPEHVQVEVHEGCVVLRGQVPPAEVKELLKCAERVQGVSRVENQLEVSDESEMMGSGQSNGNGQGS
ncbi:MAG TPA: BON domain-containing protein [Fimbriimonadaceae bacterium]|nr:BON domain-containing protein [Fimbriimonadaceae bacterium]